MKRKHLLIAACVVIGCSIGGAAIAAKISLDSPATFPVDI